MAKYNPACLLQTLSLTWAVVDCNVFMTERAEAAAAASGLDVANSEPLQQMTWSTVGTGRWRHCIVDPVASAQAASALEGGEAGMFGSSAATSELTNFGNLITGAKGQATSGGTLYVHEQADRAIQVSEKVASLLAANKRVGPQST